MQKKERKIIKQTFALSVAHSETVTVRKYWSEVMDDLLKEHETELLRKDRALKSMEERALRAERQRDDAQDKLTQKRQENYQILTELEELKGKNLILLSQLKKDYENSSKPSSEKPIHKKIHNSREKTGKRPGGQKGHFGHKRKKLKSNEKPILIEAPMDIRSNPEYYSTGKTIYKQVIDTKVIVTVTDYYALEYRRRSNGTRYHAPSQTVCVTK